MKAGQKRSLLNQHSILLQVTTLQVQDGICGPSLLFTNDSQNGCEGVVCHSGCSRSSIATSRSGIATQMTAGMDEKAA